MAKNKEAIRMNMKIFLYIVMALIVSAGVLGYSKVAEDYNFYDAYGTFYYEAASYSVSAGDDLTDFAYAAPANTLSYIRNGSGIEINFSGDDYNGLSGNQLNLTMQGQTIKFLLYDDNSTQNLTSIGIRAQDYYYASVMLNGSIADNYSCWTPENITISTGIRRINGYINISFIVDTDNSTEVYIGTSHIAVCDWDAADYGDFAGSPPVAIGMFTMRNLEVPIKLRIAEIRMWTTGDEPQYVDATYRIITAALTALIGLALIIGLFFEARSKHGGK